MMKKGFCFLLTLVLVLTAAVSALASTGDTVLLYPTTNGYNEAYSESVLIAGDKACVVLRGSNSVLRVMDLTTRETVDYPMDPMMDALNENQTEGYLHNLHHWFVRDGQLCAIVVRSKYEDTREVIDDAVIYAVDFSGEAAVLKETEFPPLDWSSLVVEESDWTYSQYIRGSVCQGDTLYLLSYDSAGVDQLYRYDLTDGFCQEYSIPDISSFGPGPDGKLLIAQYDWSGDGVLNLSFYDADSESFEKKASFSLMEATPQGFCYRQDNDTLYYIRKGEIWAAPGCNVEEAVAVNDCPISYTQGTPQMSADGFMLLSDSQTVLLRNTDPSARQTLSLKVRDFAYVSGADAAYYEYTNLHGDVTVVLDRGWSGTIDLLQAMMNQDSSGDVYTLEMTSSQFRALMNRGYMAELDSSTVLTERVQAMYPSVQESVMRDGHLMCFPLATDSSSTLSYDLIALQNLGFTEADVPTTWDGFFDFLEKLPSKLEGTKIRPFTPYTTVQDLKSSLFMLMLTSYQDYLSSGNDQNYRFNTPLMQGLLQRLENMDFAGLGVRTDYPEEGEYDGDEWIEHGVIFETYGNLTLTTYSDSNTPLLLAFGDEPPTAGYNVRVAFVNPYSQHIPEAIEFIEAMSRTMEVASTYTLSPDYSEPIRYPNYEQERADFLEEIENIRKEIEKATDPDAKANWEEILANDEAYLTHMEDQWMLSPQSIAAYRARAQYLHPSTWEFFSSLSESGDASFYETMSRFYSGEATAQDLLDILDQKYQMMRLEGD